MCSRIKFTIMYANHMSGFSLLVNLFCFHISDKSHMSDMSTGCHCLLHRVIHYCELWMLEKIANTKSTEVILESCICPVWGCLTSKKFNSISLSQSGTNVPRHLLPSVKRFTEMDMERIFNKIKTSQLSRWFSLLCGAFGVDLWT